MCTALIWLKSRHCLRTLATVHLHFSPVAVEHCCRSTFYRSLPPMSSVTLWCSLNSLFSNALIISVCVQSTSTNFFASTSALMLILNLNVIHLSGWLLILCHQRHDFQLKMHRRAFGLAYTPTCQVHGRQRLCKDYVTYYTSLVRICMCK